MRDPFRKCRDCPDRTLCRATRRLLRRYFAFSDFPRTGQAWPWDHSLCPLCALQYPYKPREDCPNCGGAGEVAERRIRDTAAEGNQDWHDIGFLLSQLPAMQRKAVEAQVFLGYIRKWKMDRIVKKLRTTRQLFRSRFCAGIRTLGARLEKGGVL